jgi:hypothetical protein
MVGAPVLGEGAEIWLRTVAWLTSSSAAHAAVCHEQNTVWRMCAECVRLLHLAYSSFPYLVSAKTDDCVAD